MGKIEKVKKMHGLDTVGEAKVWLILSNIGFNWALNHKRKVAKEICQVLELKPDEGRLLTDEEILNALAGLHDRGVLYCASVITGYQDVKSTKFCQARIEALIEEIEHFELFTNYAGDFRAVLVSTLKATHTSKGDEG